MWASNTTATVLFVASGVLFAVTLLGVEWFTSSTHWYVWVLGITCLTLALGMFAASMEAEENREEVNMRTLTSVFDGGGFAVTSIPPNTTISPGVYVQGIAAIDREGQARICTAVISEDPFDTTINCS